MPSPVVTLYQGGKPRATRKQAEEAAKKCGTPETGYAVWEREDGTFIPIVMLRADQFWMQEHVNSLGAVAYPAEYDLPARAGQLPNMK